MRLDLSVLNEEQREAVTAGDGPLLVLAGAGTGKTRVIVYRIAHLIQRGTPGNRILGITFTNKAAKEMDERLGRMYPDLDPRPWLSTFHSLGFRLLRMEHEALGFRKRFPIYDESDSRGVLTEVLREIVGVTGAENTFDDVRRAISIWKNRLRSPEEALDESEGDDAFLRARAYARYQDRLDGLNAVDFDDLIYRPVRLLEENDEVRQRWTERFDHVLIDEYQDSNTAQYRLARALVGERENLCVVGDDDQSIYAFRGAEVEKILSFQRDFPRARTVTLEANYRSVGTILDAANAVIGCNPRRHSKRLRSVRGAGSPIPYLTLEGEEEEAEEVVRRLRERKHGGVAYAEQAILMRSAIQARHIEEKLRLFQIPYTLIGGQSFFERKEIRDVLAFLRLLVTPEDDIALLRILNTPRRGFGKGGRERLDQWARAGNVPLYDALGRLDEIEGLTSPAREGGAQLRDTLGRARRALVEGQGGADVLRKLLEEIDYERAIRDGCKELEDVEFRRRGVGSLLDSIARFEDRRGAGNLDSYLTGISLASKSDGDEEAQGDELTLLTFHGAKGLEFKYVTLVGIDDQLVPHARALSEDGPSGEEEERRLFYVALTRAQDGLLLTRAAQRRRFGKEVETEESRFVGEIPENLVVRKDMSVEDVEPLDTSSSMDRLAALRARFGSSDD